MENCHGRDGRGGGARVGPIFLALDPSDTKTRISIANIVGYLESIQEEE